MFKLFKRRPVMPDCTGCMHWGFDCNGHEFGCRDYLADGPDGAMEIIKIQQNLLEEFIDARAAEPELTSGDVAYYDDALENINNEINTMAVDYGLLECPACQGMGFILCPDCKGTGFVVPGKERKRGTR